MCRSCPDREKAIPLLPLVGKAEADAAESETLCMRRLPKRENREILLVSVLHSGLITAKRNGQKTSPTVLLT